MSGPAPESIAPRGGRTARVTVAVAVLLGAVAGDLAWRAQVDAALRDPPLGWRNQAAALDLTSLHDWGPLQGRAAAFAPVGGVTWRPQSGGPGGTAEIAAQLRLPAEGWAELWLGDPQQPAAVGLRLDRLGAGQARLLGAGAGLDCAAALPTPGDRLLAVRLSAEVGAVHVEVDGVRALCGGLAPPEGAAIRTGERRVELHQVELGGVPAQATPRPYRAGAWLIGGGLAACLVLAQLAVGSPAWVAALTLAPMLAVLPLAQVDPGPAYGLPLGVPDPGPYGPVGAPALLSLCTAVWLQAGRAMRDPRPGRDWPWAAPAAAAMPAGLLNAWVNPPDASVASTLIGLLGGLCAVASLVGSLALAGHRRPRRAAALALVPAVVFAGVASLIARDLRVVGAAALAGLLMGVAAAELTRQGVRRPWTPAALGVLTVLTLEIALRAGGPGPAPPRQAPPPPTPEQRLAVVWGERSLREGDGPGSVAAALGGGWAARPGPAPPGASPPDLHVIVVGERLIHSQPLGPPGLWGAALDLRAAWTVARTRALAPALLPRVEALLARAAADGAPAVLVLDPLQRDPGALASVRAGLAPHLARGAPPAALVDPAAAAWRSGLPFAEGSGWLQTPEGAEWFAAQLRVAVQALGLPVGAPPAHR
ncbi:MAG: hypothetical protein JNM72_16920 [Deltaproteobacteria bacterium]|nr:hypothetical protein [Deltaproteobacteria bacterium]